MEQEMPDYETIRAAVVSEKWALEKVLACYGDEINRLAMVKKRQPDGSVKEEIDDDLRPVSYTHLDVYKRQVCKIRESS